MGVWSYIARPTLDYAAGITLTVFVASNFAGGFVEGGLKTMFDRAKAEVTAMLKPDWMPEMPDWMPAWMTGGREQYSDSEGAAFIRTASQFIGKHEARDRQELADFIKRAGISINPDNVAWCAAFTHAVLYANGVKGTEKLNARSYLSWGKGTTTPQEGDIVVLWRGSRNGWQGHVGFYKGTDAQGNILILGGNQGDKVSIEAFSPSRLMGYRTNRKLILGD